MKGGYGVAAVSPFVFFGVIASVSVGASLLRKPFPQAGKRAVFRVEAGVRHAFMNDTRPDVYDAVAAAAGWDAMLAFLRAELA